MIFNHNYASEMDILWQETNMYFSNPESAPKSYSANVSNNRANPFQIIVGHQSAFSNFKI